MKNIIKKIAKTVVNILTVLIFIILILVMFAKVNMLITGGGYFELFGYSVFKVTTGSMEPVINKNDIILVKNNCEFNVDDIITYKSNNDYITHRVIQINNDLVISKGDANNTNDAAFNKSNVVGKVVKIFVNLGIWQTIFTTPEIIISIFVTLILFDFAFSYKGKNKEISKKDLKKLADVDLSLLKKIQENQDVPKLSTKELANLCDKINDINSNKNTVNNLKIKEKDFLEYTIRLDLTELQKEINDNINKK